MSRIIILSFLLNFQSVNVSFLGVECIPEEGIIRTFLKLNFNDFIFDYRVNINDDQSFDPSGKIDTTEILLSKYLNDRVQISADNISLKGKLTKIESANGELKIEASYYYNKKAKQIKVKNIILTDTNKDQSNLLIFKHKNFEEGVELSPLKKEYIFKVKRSSGK
jgi:hypothetical protein